MPTIIPPSRVERALRSASYILLGLLGIWAAFEDTGSTRGPLGMSAALGHALTLIWSALMATSIIAGAAAAAGRFRTEYAALPWFGSALIAATVWTWLWVGTYPSAVGHAAVATALCLQLATRYVNLHLLMRRGGPSWTSSS